MKRHLFLCVITFLGVLILANEVPATTITYTATDDTLDLSASVKFEDVGATLIVTLTNIELTDVLVPADILTGVFFDLVGNPTLTPLSAVLRTGSTVLFGGSDPGGVVGGEWAYSSGLSGAPEGAAYGISSSGLGLFGPGDRFPGSNLQGPDDPNGLQYGITSAGDDQTTGNAKVTGTQALIQNSVVFELGGLSPTFNPSTDISNVSFQYGTDLCEPNLRVPEPTTMLLLGIGLIGLAGLSRRKFK